MLRRPIRALLAIFAGLLISLSAPGLALAHGHAHEELLDHSAEAHHGPLTIEGAAAIGEDAQHDGHGHPSVDPGLFSRLAQLPPSLVSPHVAVVDFNAALTGALAVPPLTFESPPGPFSARPEQPRAPPAV